MVKCLVLMKASHWDLLVVKSLAIYLEMYMESHLGLILEQSWALGSNDGKLEVLLP